MENKIEIGKRIRAQREFLGMSREKLAERLDVSVKFCSDIELGVKGFSVDTLINLCDVLKLSADYILFGKENAADTNNIARLLAQCPPEKAECLEEIIKAFIRAV